MRPWEVLDSQYLLRRRWLNVREDRVRTSTGQVIDQFHVLETPSWACVCCFTDEDELVLIEQYRHGVQQVTLELPAGVIETGESPLMGAQRELREETGYEASSWHDLGALTPEPARHTHQAHLFLARGARRTGDQHLDANEDVRVQLVSHAAIHELIGAGRVNHAVHVAALLLAEHAEREGRSTSVARTGAACV